MVDVRRHSGCRIRARALGLLTSGAALLSPLALVLEQGCSSDGTATSSRTGDAGGEEKHERILACAPANDAGIAAATQAGVTAKILKPTEGQKFTTKDKVLFQGTGSDRTEGNISDKTRMIWNILDPVKGPTPDGEGPEDEAGPYAAGTYVIRFDVSNKACQTAADSVTIKVE